MKRFLMNAMAVALGLAIWGLARGDQRNSQCFDLEGLARCRFVDVERVHTPRFDHRQFKFDGKEFKFDEDDLRFAPFDYRSYYFDQDDTQPFDYRRFYHEQNDFRPFDSTVMTCGISTLCCPLSSGHRWASDRGIERLPGQQEGKDRKGRAKYEVSGAEVASAQRNFAEVRFAEVVHRLLGGGVSAFGVLDFCADF